MESKRYYYLLALSVLAIVLSSMVSASGLDHSGGADPERAVAIENIEFNIPDGYVKNDTKTIINKTGSSGDVGFLLNQESYENYNGDEIIISVVRYDGMDVDEEMLSRICGDGDSKTLMGYPGYVNENDNATRFTYAFNNKVVSITASNEDLINQTLVVEDA